MRYSLYAYVMPIMLIGCGAVEHELADQTAKQFAKRTRAAASSEHRLQIEPQNAFFFERDTEKAQSEPHTFMQKAKEEAVEKPIELLFDEVTKCLNPKTKNDIECKSSREGK